LVYQFNQITLDTAQYSLCLSGKPISVEPQGFDLLNYLITNRDRVVTRHELLENLWKGKVVTDSALGARLKAARKAVGDSGGRQEVIKTIHGRGYQFVSSITEIDAEKTIPEQPDAKINKTNQAVKDTPSIAVLPCKNMSGDPEQGYFADGMSEDIITTLSRLPDLIVIARNSTFVYKERAVDVRQVGKELGVGHVLEGSVRKSGNRLRITAQLVNSQNGDHVWAERYDRNLDDIFAIQDEITHNIVVELQVKLVLGEGSRLLASSTKSVEAWELATRSSVLIDSHIRDDTAVAKQLLAQALEFDNNYPTAWVLMGWVYWQESIWNWCPDPDATMQKALEAAEKALSVDPDFPMGYSLLGDIHMVLGDTKLAIAMSEKAVELAPNNSVTQALLGNVLIDSGRVKEGIQKMQKAIRLCPFPLPWYLLVLGAGFHLIGDNNAAVFTLNQAIEREPDAHLAHIWLASTLVEIGKLNEAKMISEKVLDIEPNFSAVNWADSFKSKSHERLKDNLLAAGLPE